MTYYDAHNLSNLTNILKRGETILGVFRGKLTARAQLLRTLRDLLAHTRSGAYSIGIQGPTYRSVLVL